MRHDVDRPRSTIAAVVFGLLDPLAYGAFLAALIFDIAYDKSADILWLKAAAWLIVIGLLSAVLPRLINLVQVWVRAGSPRLEGEVASFWLNLLAIVAAIVNAFVHSRDAYATMPEGVWLSVVTVVLLVLARIVIAFQFSTLKVAT